MTYRVFWGDATGQQHCDLVDTDALSAVCHACKLIDSAPWSLVTEVVITNRDFFVLYRWSSAR